MEAPTLEFAEHTDPGMDPEKQVNEDSCTSAKTSFGFLSVVCDGMGGHAGGAEASQLAIATILEVFGRTPTSATPRDALVSALEEANARVCTMPSADRHARPGSTAVAILLHEEGAEVAHVGDSRCYLLHQGQISQITKDHSMVQQLVDAKVLTKEQAENHPDANVITRALGMGAEVEVEARPEPVPFVDGDVFLLCSDGLCDLVKPHELLEIAEKGDLSTAAKALVDLANERGGHDNITVQLVRTRAHSKASRAVKPTAVQTEVIPQPGGLRDTWGRVPKAQLAPTPMVSVIPPVAPVPRFSNHPVSEEPEDKARTSMFIGIGLAALGILIAVIVLALEMSRRGGGHQDHVPTMLPSATPVVPAAPTESATPPSNAPDVAPHPPENEQ